MKFLKRLAVFVPSLALSIIAHILWLLLGRDALQGYTQYGVEMIDWAEK